MNQSAIKELNELINEEYSIEINLSQSVILCGYDEGELEESFYYPSIYDIKLHAKPENIKEELRSSLNVLMKEIVDYGTLEKYYQECFNYTDDSIVSLRLVNENRTKPSEEEVELWKSGEYSLYHEYTYFETKINGTTIGAELISKLIESEEYDVEQVTV
jgi:hypothetical protein